MIRLWTFGVVIVAMASGYCILYVAPPEAMQGYVQKIFYIHISSALSMYVGFLSAGVGSLLYLLRRAEWADALAVAGAEVGVVFCTIVLTTGPIWARPIWGVWWTWDPRLTSTLFCWLIFVSYILVRHALENPERRRLVSAAVAIIGLLDIPIIHFAVKLWRGAHPSVKGTKDAMPMEMYTTLYLTMTAVIGLATLLIRLRYLIERRRETGNFLQEGMPYA
ncbi:MAG: cytochrome c biogenesis protein CcsA [Deltaproteobacteria bacterium]|nr:cytochrome c biogenesis protein CcsA [Deltaproteobacteria bacterium]